MFVRFILVLVTVFAIAGCGTNKINIENVVEAQKYDPASTARIRIFSGQGIYAGYVVGQTCEEYYNVSKKSGIIPPPGWRVVRDHTKEELSSITLRYPSDYQNNIIGMPGSAKTQNVNTTNGYFDERVMPAGQTFIASLWFGAAKSSCSPASASFIPQAGKDYEVRLDYTKESYLAPTMCHVGVYELQSTGGSSSVTREIPNPTNYCLPDSLGTYHTITTRDNSSSQ
ncbi:hypothetical protein [Pseudomonas putida]|uniref:hypothetical protein n=1 Tax=Pseudomonas putida TaxID=303 RepID=UPI00236700F2|nr:hypothetical protein [Pseudomonas putida]MDD2050678.1 hypothetical protein [Pseudomonas putida]